MSDSVTTVEFYVLPGIPPPAGSLSNPMSCRWSMSSWVDTACLLIMSPEISSSFWLHQLDFLNLGYWWLKKLILGFRTLK